MAFTFLAALNMSLNVPQSHTGQVKTALSKASNLREHEGKKCKPTSCTSLWAQDSIGIGHTLGVSTVARISESALQQMAEMRMEASLMGGSEPWPRPFFSKRLTLQ
jgi:hypothetical protein